MPEDARDMTVSDLKKYIANLPDELIVYVGLDDTGLETLNEILFTTDYVALMHSDNGDIDADTTYDASDTIDVEAMSREKLPRAASEAEIAFRGKCVEDFT